MNRVELGQLTRPDSTVRRFSPPLLILGLVALTASCDGLLPTAKANGTPIGVVVMNSRTKGAGYTSYPKINFYRVGSATFATSTNNSDSCRVDIYDPSSATTAGNAATQIGGGAFVISTVSGRTDSLYKAVTEDQTYHPSSLAGIPFNPGDSVTFRVPGDGAGFPAFVFTAGTAEPFAIARPVIPASGLEMPVAWTPAVDNNSAMNVSLIYNKGGGTALNRVIFCNFNDDGQGMVQSSLLDELNLSAVPFVLKAQRVKASVAVLNGNQAYLNVITTFDRPTPVSP